MNLKYIVAIILLVSVGAAYYWFDIRPNQQREKCIETSIKAHNVVWNRYCIQLGLEEGCKLPSDKAETLYMINENEVYLCIERY